MVLTLIQSYDPAVIKEYYYAYINLQTLPHGIVKSPVLELKVSVRWYFWFTLAKTKPSIVDLVCNEATKDHQCQNYHHYLRNWCNESCISDLDLVLIFLIKILIKMGIEFIKVPKL